MPQPIELRDVREIEDIWAPKGAREDVARFADLKAAQEEHKALDWQKLVDQFPIHPQQGGVFRTPTFGEFVEISKAGAAQLHADEYLAVKEAAVARVEEMSSEEYQAYIEGRALSQTDVVDAMRARLGNERSALSNLGVEVPVRGTHSQLKRGITAEGKLSVPARLFTGLSTARAIFEGSDFDIKGKYTIPHEGSNDTRVLVLPIKRLLAPRQPVDA